MSTIKVENLTGLASGANANKIIVPAGQTLHAPGHVIQTLSTTLTSASSAQSNSYVDSGLTLSITPKSTSSKILVTGFINVAEDFFRTYIILVRDSTTLSVGDAASNRPRVYASTATTSTWDVYDITSLPINTLDSPNTTSAVNYKIQYKNYQGPANSGSATSYINRSHSDRDDSLYDPRTVSVLTLQEIAQ